MARYAAGAIGTREAQTNQERKTIDLFLGDAVCIHAGKARWTAVLRGPLHDKQQDLILHAVLRELNGHSIESASDAIFPVASSAEPDVFQYIFRFHAARFRPD